MEACTAADFKLGKLSCFWTSKVARSADLTDGNAYSNTRKQFEPICRRELALPSSFRNIWSNGNEIASNVCP